jgi:hypothetical protein
MSYIKEPKGIDLIINSEPVSSEFQDEITRFIKSYKQKQKKKAAKTPENRTANLSRKKVA